MKRARESDVIIDLTSDNWHSESDIEVVDVQVVQNNPHLGSFSPPGPDRGAGKNKQEKVYLKGGLQPRNNAPEITTLAYNSDNSEESEEEVASEWTSDVGEEDEPYIDENGSETEHNMPETGGSEHNSDENTHDTDDESTGHPITRNDTSEAMLSKAGLVPSTPQLESSVVETMPPMAETNPPITESLSSTAQPMPSVTATVPSVESATTNAPATAPNALSTHLFTDPGHHPDRLPKFITITVVSIVPYKESRREIRWLPRKPFYRLLDGFSSENVVIVHNNQSVKIYSTPSQVDPTAVTMKLLVLTKRQFQDTMLLSDPHKAFAAALDPEQPESVVDVTSADEKQFPIKLKGALGLVRVMVTMSTRCEQLMQHYAKEMNISSPISIKLDGDDVDPETTVEEMDLEEDDMLDVHS